MLIVGKERICVGYKVFQKSFRWGDEVYKKPCGLNEKSFRWGDEVYKKPCGLNE